MKYLNILKLRFEEDKKMQNSPRVYQSLSRFRRFPGWEKGKGRERFNSYTIEMFGFLYADKFPQQGLLHLCSIGVGYWENDLLLANFPNFPEALWVHHL